MKEASFDGVGGEPDLNRLNEGTLKLASAHLDYKV